MRPVSEDIIDILTSSSSGLSLTFGTDLFAASEPPTPNNVITIYDTGGWDPTPTLARDILDRPTFQIKSRHVDYLQGYAALEAIRRYLLGVGEVSIGAIRYLTFTQSGDIIAAGRDEKNRAMFTVNFITQRTE